MKKITPAYIYSIIGIALVLFFLGIFGWILINGKNLESYVKQKINLEVILHDNTREENAVKLDSILKAQPYVTDAKYTSKEEAATEFSKEWGEDFTQLLDENPLYASISLSLQPQYVNQDSIAKIEEFIKQSNIVREITYPKNIVGTINANIQKASLVLSIVALLLFVSVVILIDNTVRLAMFSNRMLIKTMQMVGATRWFIARPFDNQAIISGFLSGVVAVGAIFLVKYYVLKFIPELNVLDDPKIFYLLMGALIILGILISLLSTQRAVFKYLKKQVDKLY